MQQKRVMVTRNLFKEKKCNSNIHRLQDVTEDKRKVFMVAVMICVTTRQILHIFMHVIQQCGTVSKAFLQMRSFCQQIVARFLRHLIISVFASICRFSFSFLEARSSVVFSSKWSFFLFPSEWIIHCAFPTLLSFPDLPHIRGLSFLESLPVLLCGD